MIGYWTNQNVIAQGIMTRTEQEQNAREIWGYFQSKGWNIYPVCGMLGNMEIESFLNPAQWQIGSTIENPDPQNVDGYGLVQWTPWQKYVNATFGSWYAGDNWRTNYIRELDRIQYEVDFDAEYPNQGQWISRRVEVPGGFLPPMSFEYYAEHPMSPDIAARVFYLCYERGTGDITPRANAAIAWYNYLSEVGPLPPSGRPIPIWLLFKLKERYK